MLKGNSIKVSEIITREHKIKPPWMSLYKINTKPTYKAMYITQNIKNKLEHTRNTAAFKIDEERILIIFVDK